MAPSTHHGQADRMLSAGCTDHSLDHPWHHVASGPAEMSRTDKHRLSGGSLGGPQRRHWTVGKSSLMVHIRLTARCKCNSVHCGILASYWSPDIRMLRILTTKGIQMPAGNLPRVDMGNLRDSQSLLHIQNLADSREPVTEGNPILGDIHLAERIQAAGGCLGISPGIFQDTAPRTSLGTALDTSPGIGLGEDTWPLAHRGLWHPGAGEFGKKSRECLEIG